MALVSSRSAGPWTVTRADGGAGAQEATGQQQNQFHRDPRVWTATVGGTARHWQIRMWTCSGREPLPELDEVEVDTGAPAPLASRGVVRRCGGRHRSVAKLSFFSPSLLLEMQLKGRPDGGSCNTRPPRRTTLSQTGNPGALLRGAKTARLVERPGRAEQTFR